MVDMERKVGDNFIEIDAKLRRSFQAIREDIESIKQKLADKAKLTSDTETKKEVKLLKEKLSSRISDLDKNIEDLRSVKPKSDDSALRELTKQISSLKGNIVSKQDLESLKEGFNHEIQLVKKQISKTGIKEEISRDLNTKLTSNLGIIAEGLNESRSSIEKNQQELIKKLEKEQSGLIRGFEKEVKNLRDRTEKEKQDLTNEFKSEVTRLKRELTITKNDFTGKLNEKDENIKNFEKLKQENSSLKNKLNKNTKNLETKINELNEKILQIQIAPPKEKIKIIKKQKRAIKFRAIKDKFFGFFKKYTKTILNYGFQCILTIFLLTLLFQQFYPKLVSNYIDVNWFMIAVIVVGALSIIFPPQEITIKKNKKTTWKDYLFIGALGIAGFTIIKIKTTQLGWLSWLISALAGILIILLSALALNEEEENQF